MTRNVQNPAAVEEYKRVMAQRQESGIGSYAVRSGKLAKLLEVTAEEDAPTLESKLDVEEVLPALPPRKGKR